MMSVNSVGCYLSYPFACHTFQFQFFERFDSQAVFVFLEWQGPILSLR